MGFNEGRITLDSPNGAYFPGQKILGQLTFREESVKTFRGIFVRLKGFCKVHWTTEEKRTNIDGHDESETINHDSYEEYVNVKIYLAGGSSGEYQLGAGHHDFSFSFHLPHNCPSSFEGEYGHVRYTIKAVVDRAFQFDLEKKVAVRVMCPLDLNANPYSKEPIEMELNDVYCCCCMRSGATDTVINVPLSGYCPGQTMPIEIACSNKGSVNINNIKLHITKKVTFTATNSPGTRYEKAILAEIIKGSIPGNTTRNYSVRMAIPAFDVYNMDFCQYIKVENKFKVIVSPSGCHQNSKASRKILIGTIPLVGYQDNVQNPLHDQMPQQTASVTHQPLPSYHINPPAPVPYLSGNLPYPNNPPPYPGNTSYSANVPYPTEKWPHAPHPTGVRVNPFGNPTENTASSQSMLGQGWPGSTIPGAPSINPVYPVPVNPFESASAPVRESRDSEKKSNE